MISAFKELPMLREVSFLLLGLLLYNVILTVAVILLGFFHARERRRADDLEDQLNRGLTDTLHAEVPTAPPGSRHHRGKGL